MGLRRRIYLDTAAYKILDRMVLLWRARAKAKVEGDSITMELVDDELAHLKEGLKELKDEDRKKQGGGRL